MTSSKNNNKPAAQYQALEIEDGSGGGGCGGRNNGVPSAISTDEEECDENQPSNLVVCAKKPAAGPSKKSGATDDEDEVVSFLGADDDLSFDNASSYTRNSLGPIPSRNPYFSLYLSAAVIVVVLLSCALLVPTAPTVTHHRICQAAYTHNTSWKELTDQMMLLETGNEHLCFNGNDDCKCHNPLQPQEPPAVPILQTNGDGATTMTLSANDQQAQLLRIIQAYASDENRKPLDVVLLGDASIEHWQGTEMTQTQSTLLAQKQLYQDLFQPPGSAASQSTANTKTINAAAAAAAATTTDIYGLALGVAVDGCSDLWYRLTADSVAANASILDDALHPKVWWLSIGSIDILPGLQCSVDAVTLGILQIAQFLAQERPNAVIVINSLFPMVNITTTTNATGNDDSAVQTNDNLLYWTDYAAAINDRLECYCAGEEQMEFFDATPLVLLPMITTATATTSTEEQQQQGPTANVSLYMPDGQTLNGLGSQLWGRAIVQKVLELEGRAKDKSNVRKKKQQQSSSSGSSTTAVDTPASTKTVGNTSSVVGGGGTR